MVENPDLTAVKDHLQELVKVMADTMEVGGRRDLTEAQFHLQQLAEVMPDLMAGSQDLTADQYLLCLDLVRVMPDIGLKPALFHLPEVFLLKVINREISV